MTPRDVLAAWWAEQINVEPCYEYLESGQIACRETHICWLGLPLSPGGQSYDNDAPKFDYALRENGPIKSVLLADPELFMKLSQIIKDIKHAHY